MPQAPAFPLRLNLPAPKYLALRLPSSEFELEYFRDKKEDKVRQLEMKQHKNGKIKVRTVYSPSREYKRLLKRINRLLLRSYTLTEGVLGGIVGKSIDELASFHCGKEAVFSIDLENFFPNIKSGMVYKIFERAGCLPPVCNLLTDLVTLKDSLPQGYPTSTTIANCIGHDLDVQQLAMCRKVGITRTRWVDDITFSGRTSVLKQNSSALIGAVKYHHFSLNPDKSIFKVRNNHPVVVGLDVSGTKPKIPIKVIEKVREILDSCILSGVEPVQLAYETDAWGKKKDLKLSLVGKIAHIKRFCPKDAEKLEELFFRICW